MILGWTEHQWALAYAFTDKIPKTIGDLIKVKRDYQQKHLYDPIEKATVYNKDGDVRRCNWMAAYKALEIVLERMYK